MHRVYNWVAREHIACCFADTAIENRRLELEVQHKRNRLVAWGEDAVADICR